MAGSMRFPASTTRWRFLLAACVTIGSAGSVAADGSNADERTLVPPLSYDGEALSSKDSDQVGLSVASAQEGGTYRRNAALAGGRPAKAETTWELSYLDQVKSWLTLEPDLQLVNHPDADAALRNALVLQLRSEITF